MCAKALLVRPSATKEAGAQFKCLLGRIPSTAETQVAKYLGGDVEYCAVRVGVNTGVHSRCGLKAGSVTSTARAGAAECQ